MKIFKDSKTKAETKSALKEIVSKIRSKDWGPEDLSRKYRHLHIAYCLLRGTEYSKIESPREGNKPNWRIVDQYILEYGIENE